MFSKLPQNFQKCPKLLNKYNIIDNPFICYYYMQNSIFLYDHHLKSRKFVFVIFSFFVKNGDRGNKMYLKNIVIVKMHPVCIQMVMNTCHDTKELSFRLNIP